MRFGQDQATMCAMPLNDARGDGWLVGAPHAGMGLLGLSLGYAAVSIAQ